MRTSPSAMRKSRLPGSPSLKMVLPGWKVCSRLISAIWQFGVVELGEEGDLAEQGFMHGRLVAQREGE